LVFLPEDAASVQPAQIENADDNDHMEDPPSGSEKMEGAQVHRGIGSHLVVSHLKTSFHLIRHCFHILLFPKNRKLFAVGKAPGG